jgi:hypothetical protein
MHSWVDSFATFRPILTDVECIFNITAVGLLVHYIALVSHRVTDDHTVHDY